MTPVVRTEIQRKYALAKVAAGDWLLPGNDGNTLWRVRKYEDGPSFGVEEMPHDREFWGVWKWTGLPKQWNLAAVNWTDWDLSNYGSREEAIQAALRAELPKPKPKRRKDPRPAGQILLGCARCHDTGVKMDNVFEDCPDCS